MFSPARILPRAIVDYIDSFFRHEPPPPPDGWAEASVYLPKRVAEKEGPFRFRVVPWLREIVNSIADPDCHIGTFVCGTQSAKTTGVSIINLYALLVLRINAVWMWPKTDAGRSFSVSRFKPIIDSSGALAVFKPANDDLYKNTEIHFAGAGTINFVGSHSAVDAKSRPAGLVSSDEIDDIFLGNEDDSDPITNLAERGKTYLHAKQYRIGSPTIEAKPAWRNYLAGDQRHLFIPCPHCGTYQSLEDCGPVFVLDDVPAAAAALPPAAFAAAVTVRSVGSADDWHLRWDPDARLGENEWDFDRVAATARYHCVSCDRPIEQQEKDDLMRAEACRWVPTVRAKLAGARSWRLPALYPMWPGTTFAKNATFFLQSRLTPQGRQSYENNWRARPFARGHNTADRTQLSRLAEMIAGQHVLGERVGEHTVLVVDVQRHYVIWAWFGFDAAGNMYLIDANTARDPEAIQEVDDKLHPDFVFIDSRYRTQEVYAAVHARRARWFAVRGDKTGTPLKPVYNFDPFTGERNQGVFQITLLHLNTYTWGEDLLDRLYPAAEADEKLPDFAAWKSGGATPAAPASAAIAPRIRDFLLPRDFAARSPHFLVQLYNEYIIEYFDAKGRKVRKWTENKNNHLFDLTKYARAAGSFLGFTRLAADAAAALKAATSDPAAKPAQTSLDLSTPRGGSPLYTS